MARHKSFSTMLTQLARQQARIQRERERAERAAQLSIERARKQSVRLQAQQSKDAKLNYIQARIEETEGLIKQLNERVDDLSTILEVGLQADNVISLSSLLKTEPFDPFVVPPELKHSIQPPSLESYTSTIREPSRLQKMIPGTEEKYRKLLQQANELYQAKKLEFEKFISDQQEKINELRSIYASDKQAYENEVNEHNQKAEEFWEAYFSHDPSAISGYCSLVLERSFYPAGFPQEFKIAYLPEQKEVVIEYELPNIEVVPLTSEYRYVKTKDTIEEKQRKPAEIRTLYQDIVSSVCLRTILEIIQADQANAIDIFTFNGFVQTIDPSTGHDIQPHLITVRTTKERFQSINLQRIDKSLCLKNLGAQVSPRPDALQAVKPIIDFDMVDKRFVEQSDILSDLENRPNLMELNPFEFENFVTNLFSRMGFEAKQTRTARDGGIDAVAFDLRPIVGGKVVIQAKRYKNVVGVSAVRDLYGTMINEGANKGILVTTSHYGTDAYDFARDKPIELIDGGGLLYLLEQQGVKAKIIMPEEDGSYL